MNHQIVPNINDKLYKKEGDKILRDNLFLQKLVYIMHDDVFRSFIKTYCNDANDINLIVIYMRLYSEIDDIYKQKYNKNITPNIMVKLLHDIFMDNKLRKYVFSKYNYLQ
jgi:hypothetical protein